MQISFVIPCLNEEQTIESVISDCHQGGRLCEKNYDIIVADNGSTDRSVELAELAGANVQHVKIKGYGAALKVAIQQAQGNFLIMADADCTYNFQQAPEFISKIEEGYDLVMGNRFKGKIEKGAMPFLHYYVGNPILSFFGRLFFDIKIGDFHCGIRAFRKTSIESLNLKSNGMEFASEMVIKARLSNLKMTEIPTTLEKDFPGRRPHLKTWRDGWRHLKFMLSLSPKYNIVSPSILFLFASVLLFMFQQTGVKPFTGTNTLIFSACSLTLSIVMFTDYIFTNEMIYARLNYGSKHYKSLRKVLGLRRGTDRLYKLSGISLTFSLFNFSLLLIQAFNDLLSRQLSVTYGFLGCSFIIVSATIYLLASKLSSFYLISQK